MALTSDLIGLGMPPALANIEGLTAATVAGVGTARTGAGAITTQASLLTTAGGQTAVVLPASASLLTPFYLFNTTATTALVFPPSGGAIDGGSTNASINLAQNKGVMLMRISTNVWRSVAGA